MTLTIDAHENRDVMSADVPNAFIQTKMPEVKEGDPPLDLKPFCETPAKVFCETLDGVAVLTIV